MRAAVVLPLLSLAVCAAALGGCTEPAPDAPIDFFGPEAGLVTASDTPPTWAAEAVWYQVFLDRFRNGDPSNDPTPASMEGAWPPVGEDSLADVGWKGSEWTADWYARAPWERRLRGGDAASAAARRYGGDLQGVLDALPYLDSLGVTALALSPVTDSPSALKDDARTFRHVDPHFGPDPEGDRAMMAVEDPGDPTTWSTTAADGLFLDLIEAAHARGMRVVVDVSWHRTGTQFWAYEDLLANGPASAYADWYRLGDGAGPEADGPASPEFAATDLTGDPERGVPLEGDLAPGPKGHVAAVTARWLDPDGDGDPADGVDGFRLGAAERVPLGFWRDYRRLVKTINPEAMLVGEIWWQDRPETLRAPAPYLGDVFDAVTHFRPFRPLRQFLDPAGPQISAVEAAAELADLYADVPPDHLPALLSMSGGLDTPRLGTTFQNAGVPYGQAETPRDGPGYDVTRPDSAAWRSVALYRLLQATLPGTPHVYYGDEAGMWGAGPPDNRKPMVWPDLSYAPEAALPGDSTRRRPDPVRVDRSVLDVTRRALALRRAHLDLWARGTLEWNAFGDVLRFSRRTDREAVTVVVNLSDRSQQVGVPVEGARLGFVVGEAPAGDGGAYTMAPRTGAVFFLGSGA